MAAITTSYATETDASTYLASIGTPGVWTSASSAARVSALINASEYLDQVYGRVWIGTRKTRTQERDWYRDAAVDSDGFTLPSDEYPPALVNACAEVAVRILSGDNLLPDQTEPATTTREKASLGPMSEDVTYTNRGKGALPSYPKISRMLRKITKTRSSEITLG